MEMGDSSGFSKAALYQLQYKWEIRKRFSVQSPSPDANVLFSKKLYRKIHVNYSPGGCFPNEANSK